MADERVNEGGNEGGTGERRFFARPKFCQFCADKTISIDYKKGRYAQTVHHRRRKDPSSPSDGHLRPSPTCPGGCYQTGPSHCPAPIYRGTLGRQLSLIKYGSGHGETPCPAVLYQE